MLLAVVPQNLVPLKLSEVLSAFSLAIDLAENRPPGHARRVALLAVTLAMAVGLPREEMVNLYYAALLHDVGTSNHPGDVSVVEGGPARGWRKGGWRTEVWARVLLHPQKGAEIARQLPLSPQVADLILNHHENIDGSGYPRGMRGESLTLGARILSICDAAEGVLGSGFGTLEPRASLGKFLESRRGTVFDPSLADTLVALVNAAFLAKMEPSAVDRALRRRVPVTGDEIDEEEKLEQVVAALVRAIDLKSFSLGSHSANVARLAGALARQAGLAREKQWEISMAGLLHDIGKFAVPTGILEKPLPLTEPEVACIKRHPVYSGRVLREVEAFRHTVARWTELHHERANGGGYPYGFVRQEIPLEARIIAAADILDALTGDRPYRKGVDGEVAFQILQEQAPSTLGCEVADLLTKARGSLLEVVASKCGV